MDSSSPEKRNWGNSTNTFIWMAGLLWFSNFVLNLMQGVNSDPGTPVLERFLESLYEFITFSPEAMGALSAAPIMGFLVVLVSLIFKKARSTRAAAKTFSVVMFFLLLGSCNRVYLLTVPGLF